MHSYHNEAVIILYTMTMRSLADILFASLQKRRLIDQQIHVYISWVRRHHGWAMLDDEQWIVTFINHSGIEDVDDATGAHFDDFMTTIRKEHNGQVAHKRARLAVKRFLRYYEARTRSFTTWPRRGTFSAARGLSTEQLA